MSSKPIAVCPALSSCRFAFYDFLLTLGRIEELNHPESGSDEVPEVRPVLRRKKTSTAVTKRLSSFHQAQKLERFLEDVK